MSNEIIISVIQNMEDAAFVHDLKALLAIHKRRKDTVLRIASYKERLIAEGAETTAAMAMILLISAGQLHYSGNQWVPEIYETLEDQGLVSCIYGSSSSSLSCSSSLKSRMIVPTQEGKLIVERLQTLIEIS
jgi:hypothetical protein